MSLKSGVLWLMNEDNKEKELKTSGKAFRIGSNLSCDLVLNHIEAKRIHCEIQCDSFGRISITNHSKRNPVHINGVPLKGTRPLYTGSLITVFDKKLKWVNKHRYPRSRNDMDQLQTPKKDNRRAEQAPNSEPLGRARRKVAAKRITLHNFDSNMDMADEGERNENEEDDHQDQLTRASIVAATKSFGATPPRSVKRMTKSSSRRTIEATCSKQLLHEFKENENQVAEAKNLMLLKCHSSAMVVTSYSPKATPKKTVDSFACVMSNKNTPASAYGTPRSILSEINNEESNDGNLTPRTPMALSSMHLIDFTTPDVYKTPLRKNTPLFKSALKNSVVRIARVSIINGNNTSTKNATPNSAKKLRWGTTSNSVKKTEFTPSKGELLKSTPLKSCTTPNKLTSTVGSLSGRKSVCRLSRSVVETTPKSIINQKTPIGGSVKSLYSTSSTSKITRIIKRKSLNMTTPLKTPKVIFSENHKNMPGSARPARHSCVKTPVATPVINNSNGESIHKLNRSATFILETAEKDKEIVSESDINSKGEDDPNGTFTYDEDPNSEVAFGSQTDNVEKQAGKAHAHELKNALHIEDDNLATSEPQNGILSDELAGNVENSSEPLSTMVDNDVDNSKNQESDSEQANLVVKQAEIASEKRKSTRLSKSTTLTETVGFFVQSSPILSDVKVLLKKPRHSKDVSFTGVKELIRSPKPETGLTNIVGVKELFHTPKCMNSSNLIGVKELVNTPKGVENIDPKGLKELFNTPARDDLTNVLGIKELLNTPKDGVAYDDPKGVKELFNTPKPSTGLDDAKGVKELFNTPKTCAGIDNMKGVKELFQTPKQTLGIHEVKGVKELFNTPVENNLSNVEGVKELLKTPFTCSPQSKELMKSSHGPSCENTENLSEIFKTPKSRGVMVLNTPQSVAIEQNTSLSLNLLKTPKEVDVLEDIEEVEDLFLTPFSNLVQSRVESSSKTDLSPEESFDRLAGVKSTKRRTYGRSSVTPRVLPIPIAEESETEHAKIDIQDWLDNSNHSVDTEKDDTTNIQNNLKIFTSDGPTLRSPSVRISRKPLATSSSIKPSGRKSQRLMKEPQQEHLHEMSGIGQLEDSLLSVSEIAGVALDSDAEHSEDNNKIGAGNSRTRIGKSSVYSCPSLNTPQKNIQFAESQSKHEIKVTPQIRKFRERLPTPYREKPSKDPFKDLSIQFIDESTVASEVEKTMDKVPRYQIRNSSQSADISLKYIDSGDESTKDISPYISSKDKSARTVSAIESIKEKNCKDLGSRRESSCPIFISDDENSNTEVDKSEIGSTSHECTTRANELSLASGPHDSIEFIALDEQSATANITTKTTVSDALRSRRTISNTSVKSIRQGDPGSNNSASDVFSIGDSTLFSDTMGESISYEEKEEKLLELYDLQLSREEENDSSTQCLEMVYVDENEGNEFQKGGDTSCMREDSLQNDNTSTEKNIEGDLLSEFNNFSDRPATRRRVRGNSEIHDKKAASNKTTRKTLGSSSDAAAIDLKAEKLRQEFSNFNLNPKVRIARGLSQLLNKPVRMSLSRRTTGKVPLNPSFNLEAEQERRNLSIELANLDTTRKLRRNIRGRSLSPLKTSNSFEKGRKTMGQITESNESFDYEAELARRNKSLEFANFESELPIKRRPKNYSEYVGRDEPSTSTRRLTMGQKSGTSFNYDVELDRRNMSLEFQNFNAENHGPADSNRHSSAEFNASVNMIENTRRTVGQNPLGDKFDLEMEKERRRLSLEFENFEAEPGQITKRARGLSENFENQNQNKLIKRQTMGGQSLSEVFNLEQEAERYHVNCAFENFNAEGSRKIRERYRSQSPEKRSKVETSKIHRRTVGQRPLLNKTFDLEIEAKRREFENFETDPKFKESRSHSLTRTTLKVSDRATQRNRKTLGHTSNAAFNLQEEKAKYFENHKVVPEIVATNSPQKSAADEKSLGSVEVNDCVVVMEKLPDSPKATIVDSNNIASKVGGSENKLRVDHNETILHEGKLDENERKHILQNTDEADVEKELALNSRRVHFGDNIYYEINKTDLEKGTAKRRYQKKDTKGEPVEDTKKRVPPRTRKNTRSVKEKAKVDDDIDSSESQATSENLEEENGPQEFEIGSENKENKGNKRKGSRAKKAISEPVPSFEKDTQKSPSTSVVDHDKNQYSGEHDGLKENPTNIQGSTPAVSADILAKIEQNEIIGTLETVTRTRGRRRKIIPTNTATDASSNVSTGNKFGDKSNEAVDTIMEPSKENSTENVGTTRSSKEGVSATSGKTVTRTRSTRAKSENAPVNNNEIDELKSNAKKIDAPQEIMSNPVEDNSNLDEAQLQEPNVVRSFVVDLPKEDKSSVKQQKRRGKMNKSPKSTETGNKNAIDQTSNQFLEPAEMKPKPRSTRLKVTNVPEVTPEIPVDQKKRHASVDEAPVKEIKERGTRSKSKKSEPEESDTNVATIAVEDLLYKEHDKEEIKTKSRRVKLKSTSDTPVENDPPPEQSGPARRTRRLVSASVDSPVITISSPERSVPARRTRRLASASVETPIITTPAKRTRRLASASVDTPIITTPAKRTRRLASASVDTPIESISSPGRSAPSKRTKRVASIEESKNSSAHEDKKPKSRARAAKASTNENASEKIAPPSTPLKNDSPVEQTGPARRTRRLISANVDTPTENISSPGGSVLAKRTRRLVPIEESTNSSPDVSKKPKARTARAKVSSDENTTNEHVSLPTEPRRKRAQIENDIVTEQADKVEESALSQVDVDTSDQHKPKRGRKAKQQNKKELPSEPISTESSAEILEEEPSTGRYKKSKAIPAVETSSQPSSRSVGRVTKRKMEEELKTDADIDATNVAKRTRSRRK